LVCTWFYLQYQTNQTHRRCALMNDNESY